MAEIVEVKSVLAQDPTALTTQALTREIEQLREIIYTRLDAMDKAMIVFSDNMTRVPTDVDKQVCQLKMLHEEKITALRDVQDEKFAGVNGRFKERDQRAESSLKDAKTAVDAALQAVKDSNEKSEVATVKQIDGLVLLISTTSKASDAKIDDVKDRLTRIEGKDTGMGSAWTILLGAVALIASLIAIGSFVWAGRQQPGVYVPPPLSVTTPSK